MIEFVRSEHLLLSLTVKGQGTDYSVHRIRSLLAEAPASASMSQSKVFSSFCLLASLPLECPGCSCMRFHIAA